MQVIRSRVISADLLEKLRDAFPAPEVTPGADYNSLLYAAGQHDVVNFIERYIGKSGVASVEASEPERVTPAEKVLRMAKEEKPAWWKM